MNCKSCDNGLTKGEEVNEQCNDCIVEEIRQGGQEENDNLNCNDVRHCPTCRCNEEV